MLAENLLGTTRVRRAHTADKRIFPTHRKNEVLSVKEGVADQAIDIMGGGTMTTIMVSLAQGRTAKCSAYWVTP